MCVRAREGGRPEGTTAERGFEVGREGGRPEGTTAERGFGVGREGGRLEGTSDYVCFWVCETLSTTWSLKPLRAKQVS